MQIYSKSMKNATSPVFRNHNRSALLAWTYITHCVNYYPLIIIIIVIVFFIVPVIVIVLVIIISYH